MLVSCYMVSLQNRTARRSLTSSSLIAGLVFWRTAGKSLGYCHPGRFAHFYLRRDYYSRTMTAEIEAKLAETTVHESFGHLTLKSGINRTGMKLMPMSKVDPVQHLGKRLAIRARLHNARGTAKNAFLVLRDQPYTMQAVFFVGENVSKEMVKFAASVNKESIIDVVGELVSSTIKSDFITFKTVELRAEEIWVVSQAGERLPFQIDDAARAEEATQHEENPLPRVNLDTRLNNRVMDLRTPANQALFKIQGGIQKIAREFLDAHDFVEIHTPKLIGAASEGGANVFKLKYFDQEACLAQSPQFYKQMMICADFKRVYEVGPVFRAENSFTHRHMTEFTGFDMEMAIESHYHEALLTVAEMLMSIFRELPRRFAKEIEIIKAQYPSDEFLCGDKPLILNYKEGVAMLREAGMEMDDFEDLSTEKERRLGQLVKERYGVDFYVLDKFPLSVRPFYTMPDFENIGYSNSYDFFMRGEEIMSGAQRVHDTNFLKERALAHGIDPKTVLPYLEAFEYGAYPHAGGGIGLERVLMLYLDMKNIRKTSLFPRDPHRINP